MLQGITIAGLLESLAGLGVVILKIALLYVVLRISSGLFVWIWRTIFVPIFEKRAYFYRYNSEGTFYSERGVLGIFRFGRNYRSRINDTLIGYVATKRGQKNENPGANKIFFRRKGREFVGEANSKYQDGKNWSPYTNAQGESVCKIFLTRPDEEGGYNIDENYPVGHVDKGGRVFKYYANREDWKNRKPLEKPEFIGQCETPSVKIIGGQLDKTNEERSDADVLQYIKWKANESRFYRSEEGSEKDDTEGQFIEDRRTYLDQNGIFQMDDSWHFFRRNWPLFKKVKSKVMKGGGAVKDGKRFPYAFLSGKLWRILHVYPTGWDSKAMAWGYGYCTEGFRNPFSQTSDDFPMITRAAAALLLADKEGFYPGDDEVVSDGVPGAAATALLSLFIYMLLFPFTTSFFSSYKLFPFLGNEYSSVVSLISIFFIFWLCIINPIRCIVRYNHDGLEAFLEQINRNVGVLGWMATLVVSLVIGLVGSVFLYGMDFQFFPLFFNALTAVLVNWAYYHQLPWGISDINEDFVPDETENEENEGNGENEGNEQNEDNEDDGETVEIRHQTSLNLPAKTIDFDEIIKFNSDRLQELRLMNPFRKFLSASYEDTVQKMIEQELQEGAYSKLLYYKSLISSYVNKYHLSSVEKVRLIMRVCQPMNINYKHDEECEELYKGFDDNNSKLQTLENKGFSEYCRFPTETIHDKRGDCDCHAAFGAALLAACGFKSCFSIGNVSSDGTDDANHAMCGVECTDELKAYQRKENTFTKDGKKFILLETAGQYDLDEIMEFQKKMAEKNVSVIIEPYNKKQ